MPRPFKCRWVDNHPQGTIFKPAGIPLRQLESLELQLDELEALRQAHILGRTQEEGAAEMGISRSTFARIIENASRKISDALVNEKALIIQGGPIIMAKRTFICAACQHQWEEPFGTGKPMQCPSCKSVNIFRADAGPRGVCGNPRGGGRNRGSGGGSGRGRGRSGQ